MSELSQTIERISVGFDNFKASFVDRLEVLEANADRPRIGGTSDISREQREYKSTFLAWVRNSKDSVYERRLSDAQHDLGKKDVTIAVPSGGGFALPEEISRQIENRERQLNPFRELVRVERTSTNDYKALISMGDGTSGWVSESGTRSATASPTLRERAPTFGEQYAYPTASEWALDDVFFNVQDWLVNEIAADWAAQEATTIISGNGSNRPTGILNTTPTTAVDDSSPLRAAGTIQYVGLTNASSPQTLNVDSLITLVGTMKERYLQETDGIAFVMHRTTLALLRRTRTLDGDYLWEPSLQAGQPSRLLGYRVVTCDAMPSVGADTFPVLFGNFRRGYLLVDRVGIRVTPNPYSTPGMVSFHVRRRLGGCVLNNDAIKALRIAD